MKSSVCLFAITALASSLLFNLPAGAQTTSVNSGSLGSAGNGTNSNGVVLGQPSPIVGGGSNAVGYSLGEHTTVPFNAALNPGVATPFTIEFWANPSASDNDDVPVSNRFATGNRSGWTFFQRDAGTGWNFRMYNGVGSGLGWDLTGGTATLNAWSYVVATWNGSAALLYVNGVLADSTNDPAATGVYNPNTSPTNTGIFSVGANFDGGSPSVSTMDEVAFYTSALTPAQIASHFTTASSPTAGAYFNLVKADGAVEYLSNVPEPASTLLLSAAAVCCAGARRRRN